MMVWQALRDGLSTLSANWEIVLAAVIVLSVGCGLPFYLLNISPAEKTKPRQIALLSGFFGLSLILRLAFTTQAFVPSYFDSVEHYRIINQLEIASEASKMLETLPKLTAGYYHLGFHLLASLLTSGLRADPIDVILILGQAILALIPIPVFFLIRQETQSGTAAFFGMLLAGFGWYMPGYAVNWGKYPALAGMLTVEIVLGIAYIVSKKNSTHREWMLQAGLLTLGIVASALFHTRTLIILAVSVTSWVLAGRIRTLSKTGQYFSLVFLLLGLLFLGRLILREPLLTLVLDPYLGQGLWITLTVFAFSPFALLRYPRGFFFSLLFILGSFAALFVPIAVRSIGLENQTLLDRPFTEMALYLPLSILAGLGLAGFQQLASSIKALSDKFRSYFSILIAGSLIAFTGAMSIVNYNYYPSDCCKFVSFDDTVALDWIDRNLPPDARFLVAAAELNVLPAGPSENLVGTDAGVWIPALTGRAISLAPFDTDFRSPDMLVRLCQAKVGYIYVGGTGQIFSAAQLNERADWYDRTLFLPNVRIYQVTGCPQVTFLT